MDHISRDFSSYSSPEMGRRPNISRQAKGICSKKLRWVECERLREIIPSVAKCKQIDEVKIIKEAIKHISRLEEAVLQRIATENPDARNNITGKRVVDYVPSQFLLSIASQADIRLPNLILNQRISPVFPPPLNFIDNSTGTSPCWTDEENEFVLDLTQS
ncbi:hypothetical protein FGIG_03683 [Fasciola gigantica]|uniref:BHLH domain-containing protein n=1 Tax=Fasciola gigantica TaxID=46835 RepID=A0A504Z051_FASGI|nr:hypothetical protein FGIG_03683 [Fasciola gigantica]